MRFGRPAPRASCSGPPRSRTTRSPARSSPRRGERSSSGSSSATTVGSAPAFLVTAVARVATTIGPDVEAVRRVVRAGRPVLAAGGIRDLEDLRALRTAGAAGAVVGRAALEGTLDLATAFAERA